MSMIRNILFALIAVSALIVVAPGHAETLDEEYQAPNLADTIMEVINAIRFELITFAEPAINLTELNCLANNIFYESGDQSIEGKVAVGTVTINRVNDGRFGRSICEVVNQKTVFSYEQKQARVTWVKPHWWSDPQKQVTWKTVWHNSTVCQFSWRCQHLPKPKKDDWRWNESYDVAKKLMTSDEYRGLQHRYREALYFHAVYAHPAWAHQKKKIKRVDGQVFYKEPAK